MARKYEGDLLSQPSVERGGKALIGCTTLELLGFKANPVTGKLERTFAIEYLKRETRRAQPSEEALEAMKFEGQRCSRLTLRKLNVNLAFKNSN